MGSAYDKALILNMMDKLSFFGQFTREEKSELASYENSVVKIDFGAKIIRQGDSDTSLYVLLRGEAEVTKSEAAGKTLAHLQPGAVFGEVSFISKKPRLSTVSATSECLVLKLDQDILEKTGAVVSDKVKSYLLTLLIKRLDNMNMAIIQHMR